MPPEAMTEYVPVSSLEASSITKKCLVPSHFTRYLERTPVGTSTPFFILKQQVVFEPTVCKSLTLMYHCYINGAGKIIWKLCPGLVIPSLSYENMNL